MLIPIAGRITPFSHQGRGISITVSKVVRGKAGRAAIVSAPARGAAAGAAARVASLAVAVAAAAFMAVAVAVAFTVAVVEVTTEVDAEADESRIFCRMTMRDQQAGAVIQAKSA